MRGTPLKGDGFPSNREQGCDLTNTTDGGDGFIGWGTHEQRSAKVKKQWADRTPEQRSAIINTLQTSQTSEELSARRKRFWEQFTPEQRSEIARRKNADRTPEQWVSIKAKLAKTNAEHLKRLRESFTFANYSKGARTRAAAMTTEERKASAKCASDGMTREQRSAQMKATMKAYWASLTPERRLALVRAANAASVIAKRRNKRARQEAAG